MDIAICGTKCAENSAERSYRLLFYYYYIENNSENRDIQREEKFEIVILKTAKSCYRAAQT